MLTTISHKELTLLRSAFLNAQIDPKEFRSITKKTLGDTQLFGYEIKYAKRKIYKFISEDRFPSLLPDHEYKRDELVTNIFIEGGGIIL